MQIVQCSFGDGFAGSAKMALLSSSELIKRNHKVTMYVSKNSLTEKRANARGIPTVSFDTSSAKKTLFNEIENIFKSDMPGFFIAYHSLDRKAGIYLRRKFKNKFINIASRQNITKSTPVIGSFIYNKYFDFQIACGRGVAESLIKSGIKKNKVKILNNCIEVPLNIDEINGEIVKKNFPFNDKVILGLSTWFHKERKGFDILFKAFSMLNDNYILFIIGIPIEMQKDVLSYAAEFGIEKSKIIMPGYVENIWEYYKAMDIFILPSRSEGFSLSLLEAGAAGLPLIASNIPGNDELIITNENGILFDVDKPNQLAEAINKIANDKNLKGKIASNAKKEVMGNFLISNYAERMEEFLLSLNN